MKRLTLILFTFISTINLHAQFPSIAWGGLIDGEDIYTFTERLRTDKDNNLYSSGYYNGVTEFGFAGDSLSYDCNNGAFVICKKLPNGKVDWILPLGQNSIHDFDIDSDGNVVVFAQIYNTTDINYNGDTSVNITASHLLAKYNSYGRLIWHQTSPTSTSVFGPNGLISIDQYDNIFIGGNFSNNIDLGFSSGPLILNQIGANSDSYVAKYSSTGAFLWNFHFDSGSWIEFIDMDVNNNGDLFVIGSYSDSLTIDPNGINLTINAGPESNKIETFIARFTGSGGLGFVKSFENSDFDDFVGIQVNNVNVNLFHNLDPTENMNPNPGTAYYASHQGGILRLNTNGTYIANYPVAQTGVGVTNGSVTPSGSFLIAGLYSGTRDFNPGAGINSITALTGSDFFVSEFTSSYAYSDTRVLQPGSTSYGFDLCKAVRTSNGSIGLSGIIKNATVNLDYSGGTYNVSNLSGNDRNFISYYSNNVPELNVTDENGNQIIDGDVTPNISDGTDFGDICLNSSKTSTFVLKNTGLLSLNISGLTISGANASDFSASTIVSSIPSGGEINITINALANSLGVKNATITINNSDPDESAYSFDIQSYVHELPTTNYTISPNQTVFCYGEVVTFSGTGADSYEWNNTVINGTPFSISTSGTYEVIGTSVYGCTDTNTINIVVNALPNVSVSSNDPNNEICVNDPIQLIGAGASSYSYSGGIIDQTDFFPTATDSYTITGTDVNGCQNTDTITIIVNPLPTVSVSSNDPNNEICVNDPIQLIGAGASSYSYSGGIIDQTDFFPTATDSYTITGTDANGCQNTDVITITVNPLPVVSVTSSDPNNEVCENDPIQLIGAGASSYSYSGGVIDQTDFFPTATDSYTITGTDVNGCQNTDVITITVNPLPVVSVTSSDPNNEICENDPIQLIGAGASSYSYSGGIIDQTDFFPTATDSYTITGTDVNGCQNTDVITITVNPLPVVSVTSSDPNNEICENDPIQLIGAGASSYSYSGGIIDQTDFFPTATDSYTITGTDANGCQNTDVITITVNPLPVVSVTSSDPNNEVCENDPIQLIGAGASSYSYSGGVIDQTDFFPTATDSYTITGTDVNGCQNTDVITITVNPLPVVSVTSSDPNNEICENDPIQLIGAGASSYSYSGGVIDQTDFFPTATDSYTITGTDANGCQNTDTISITVNPAPSISAGNDQFICYGDSILLMAISSGSISWSGGYPNNSYFKPSTNSTELISSATSLEGCTNSDTLIVTMGSEINDNLSVSTDTIIAVAGYSNYAWYDCSNDSLLSSGFQNWLTVPYSGEFYAVISDNLNCTTSSDCIFVGLTNLNELSSDMLNIYPNPTSGRITVQSSLNIKQLEVYDNTGRLILITKLQGNEVDLSSFSTGNYLLKISLGNGQSILKQLIKSE